MKFKNLLIILFLTFSASALAEKLSLFAPIPGAVIYEIQIVSETDHKLQTFKLDSPVLDTDKIEAGNYIMKARFMNVRDNWSSWTDKASLKIVKKIKNNTRDVFEDKFPFGGSVGFANLATKLSSSGYEFKSDESVMRGRVFIQRLPFKINAAYDKSTHFTRFDTAVLKQIDPHSAAGINLWLVNFDGRNTPRLQKV